MEQFITEHYWGYSIRHSGGCLEYQVSHVPWQVWATARAGFEGEVNALYGSDLGLVLQQRPDCAFVADGSPVIVFKGKDANAPRVNNDASFPGPKVVDYHLPALPPGRYFYHCDVHPIAMTGTLVVK